MVIISETYSGLDKYKYKKSIITIGSFDGVHVGHQEIFNKMKDLSVSHGLNKKVNNKILITFNPHPFSVLKSKKREEKYILTPISEKLNLLKKYFSSFIDIIVVISFTKDFSLISAKIFFDKIINSFDPIDIVIGGDHGFGHNREGNIKFLKENYKNKENLKIHKIKSQKLIFSNNKSIRLSSTLIREKILSNKISEANRVLGRYYSLRGEVVKGQGVGRKINFPTINIKPNYQDQITPSRGVYFVKLEINQIEYSGMCNIGVRPTLTNSKEETIEIHIFSANIDVDFYNNEVNILFMEYIRSEKKFKNVDFLIKQLEKDKEICMSFED